MYPEAATGAIVVANKIFWALGYWQVENFLTRVTPEQIVIDESATIRPASGVRRPFARGDLDDVLRRSHRSADGSYRAVAARALPGRPIVRSTTRRGPRCRSRRQRPPTRPSPRPPLPRASFIKVELSAVGAPVKTWESPIELFFRSRDGVWSLVGLERLPEGL